MNRAEYLVKMANHIFEKVAEEGNYDFQIIVTKLEFDEDDKKATFDMEWAEIYKIPIKDK